MMPQDEQHASKELSGPVLRRIGGLLAGGESSCKFLALSGGLLFCALCVAVLTVCLMLFPQYAKVFWVVQLFFLLALLGFVVAILICAKTSFFDPLDEVRNWASEIRQGDFSARVPVINGNDIGSLADDINRLAEWLESLANDAESQLRQQAERLSAKSQSLQLLYDAAALVNLSPGDEQLISQYLDSLRTILDAKQGRAYVQTNAGPKLVTTFGQQSGAPVSGNQEKIVIPLKYREKVLGMYELYLDSDNEVINSEVCDLLPSIGRHLGMALEKTRLEQESLRLSTMEERTKVANELHDSLAQSLAALKFQVRVLDETIAQGEEPAIWQQMERVEDGLEEATQELRDLIAQFRGSARDGKVENAIAQVITQFRRRSDIKLFFHNHWDNTEIEQGAQVQIARIIQEALANTQKHSQASSVRVLLRREANGLHEAIVEDDGVGFDQRTESAHPGEHIGLTIMHERAERIGGTLAIDSERGEGTRVTLAISFPGADTTATVSSVA